MLNDRRRVTSLWFLVILGLYWVSWLYGGRWYLRVASSPRPITVVLHARRYSYSPSVIKVRRGQRVTLRLISDDVHHGLYLDGYELQISARPGQEAEMTFLATKGGRFPFRCSVTCGPLHPYMIGYLEVVPNEPFYVFGLGLTPLVGLAVIWLLMNGLMEDRILGLFPLDWRFELTRNRWILRLLKSRWVPFSFILFNLAVFTLIMLAGWLGDGGPGNYNFAIMVVWILWWVLLMLLLVPFFGRIWCAVCPLPFLGDWLQRRYLLRVREGRLAGLNRRWPRALRNMWLVNLIFLLTTFFTAFFTTRPLYTFILLAIIIVSNVIVSYVFERRSFCRYVCPVAGFQGLYANIAPLEIRPRDPDLCRRHRYKECYLGNEKGYGCPWLEPPYLLKKNTYCGLCLECFKTCSYDNMALNLRSPGLDLLVIDKRGMDEAWKAFIMIGCALVFYTIMQGPWGWWRDWANLKSLYGYLGYLTLHSFNSLVLIPILFGLSVWLSRMVAQEVFLPFSLVFVNYSYSLVPMGLAVWAAFSVGIFFPNFTYLFRVFSDPYNAGWDLFSTRGIPWTPFLTSMIPYCQAIILLLGLAFSLDMAYRLSHQTYSPRNASSGFIPLALFLISLTLFFQWLFIG